MSHRHNLKEVSIGILTWRTPVTLRATLKSYRESGLLDRVGEAIIFINECHPDDVLIAQEFGLKIITSDVNVGIGPALTQMAAKAQNPYFLFLENDWLCVEDKDTVFRRLQSGLELIKNENIDVVKYRHRVKFGLPLYSMRNYKNNEIPEGLAYLLDAIHWTDEPEKAFSRYISKKKIGGEDWFFATSENANYTNNPCLYKKQFLEKNITSKAAGPGIALEADLEIWWKNQHFNVAQGEGLFEHRPLEISGKGYSVFGPYFVLQKRFFDSIKTKLRALIAKKR